MTLQRWTTKPRLSETHEKAWGEEEWIVNNMMYCGKILRLNKGWRCSMHKHEIKRESFYVLKGSVCLHTDDRMHYLTEGDSIDIDRGVYHSFVGIEDCELLEFSTQHFEEDSYRLDHSGPIDVDWYMQHVFPKAQ